MLGFNEFGRKARDLEGVNKVDPTPSKKYESTFDDRWIREEERKQKRLEQLKKEHDEMLREKVELAKTDDETLERLEYDFIYLLKSIEELEKVYGWIKDDPGFSQYTKNLMKDCLETRVNGRYLTSVWYKKYRPDVAAKLNII